MANICLYKILVKGRKKACYKLIDMMPLYSSEKYIVREEGTDEKYELVFTGDCKWSVDSYTSRDLELEIYNDERLDAINDGDGWGIPLQQKSFVLDCEIFCNSKDIDDSSWSVFVHFNKGKEIHDECPKELHIKRGRDYDCYDDLIETEYGMMTQDDYNGLLRKKKIVTAKVKFEKGSYWYLNPDNLEIGDLVYVDSLAKEGCLGKIIEISNQWDHWAGEKIKEKVGTAKEYHSEEVEAIWKSYKPKDRKEFLKSIDIDETITKQKFLNIIEAKWNKFNLKNDNWEEFIKQYK